MTMGKKAFRVSVIGYDSVRVGWNCRILGYMSSGEMVPEVMTTEEKRSNTGAIANDGSRHLYVSAAPEQEGEATHVKWKIGFGTVACSVSYGSRISKNPFSYVATNVPKLATFCSE
jgi:hypothetical protein